MSDLERHYERIIRDEISRRRLLGRGAAGALSMSALAYLAACGEKTGGSSESKQSEVIKKGKIAGPLYVANWPLYIDEKHETLKKFEQRYDVSVKYVEENAGAQDVMLTEEDLRRIEEAMPRGSAAGERYTEQQMRSVNR